MRAVRNFLANRSGAVTIEAAFLVPLMIVLTAGAVEIGYAFYQWNGAHQAARHGARLAATSNPVPQDLRTMTGLGGGVKAGDPMPDYTRECFGKSQSCTGSAFNRAAMNAIVYGPDQDMTCEATNSPRRGICDVFSAVSRQNVDISYKSSGLGRAGFPADPEPLITVTIKDLQFNFLFLDLIIPKGWQTIPTTRASHMGEDLRSG
jgi:Flp pilus assembly protein TadG